MRRAGAAGRINRATGPQSGRSPGRPESRRPNGPNRPARSRGPATPIRSASNRRPGGSRSPAAPRGFARPSRCRPASPPQDERKNGQRQFHAADQAAGRGAAIGLHRPQDRGQRVAADRVDRSGPAMPGSSGLVEVSSTASRGKISSAPNCVTARPPPGLPLTAPRDSQAWPESPRPAIPRRQLAPVTTISPMSGRTHVVASAATHCAAVKPAVPNIMLSRKLRPTGSGTGQSAGTRMNCE